MFDFSDPNSQINANLCICFSSSVILHRLIATWQPVVHLLTLVQTPVGHVDKHDESEDRVVAGLVRPVHCGEVADCEVEVSKVADEVRSSSSLLGFLGSLGWQHICNSVQVFGVELSIE